MPPGPPFLCRRAYLLWDRKLEAYIRFARKWGGAFIIIAALFPFTPFSLVVIALARLFRFLIQGIFFFDLLKVDTWFVQAF